MCLGPSAVLDTLLSQCLQYPERMLTEIWASLNCSTYCSLRVLNTSSAPSTLLELTDTLGVHSLAIDHTRQELVVVDAQPSASRTAASYRIQNFPLVELILTTSRFHTFLEPEMGYPIQSRFVFVDAKGQLDSPLSISPTQASLP